MQLLHGGVETPVSDGRVAADVAHAIASGIRQVLIVGRAGLAAKLHQDRLLRVGPGGGARQSSARTECEGSGCGGDREKVPTVGPERRHECLLA
jgi:hypothetical protein